MGVQKPENLKGHICAALLAHVDAGKTTLSESIFVHDRQYTKTGTRGS